MKKFLILAVIVIAQSSFAGLIKQEWKDAVHTKVVINWEEKVEYLIRIFDNAWPTQLHI